MNASRKRTLILSAAKEIFSEYGFKKTTIEDIAQAVKMTKSNLYFYVSSKQELYDLVVSDSLLHWHERVVDAISGQKDLIEGFRMMATYAFDYLHEDTQLCSIIVKDPSILSFSQREDRFRVVNQQSLGSIEAMLTEGVKQGVFRSVDVHQTAEFFFSIYVMLLIKTYVKKEPGARDEFSQALDIIVRGIIRQ